MPKIKNQDLFEPAYCICGKRAELRITRRGTYCYWHCGTTWVIEGSEMDTQNKEIEIWYELKKNDN